jgi:hypothetical protein
MKSALWSLTGWLMAWLMGAAGIFIQLAKADRWDPPFSPVASVLLMLWIWAVLLAVFELPFLYLVLAGFPVLREATGKGWAGQAALWLLWGACVAWVVLLPVGLLLGGPFGWVAAIVWGSVAFMPVGVAAGVLGLVEAAQGAHRAKLPGYRGAGHHRLRNRRPPWPPQPQTGVSPWQAANVVDR